MKALNMFLSQIADIDWWQVLDRFWHLIFACALAVPIGLAAVQDRFEIAMVLGLLNLFTLLVMGRLKRSIDHTSQRV